MAQISLRNSFLNCHQYEHDRHALVENILFLNQTDINILLCGNANLSYEDNTKIVDAVHFLIK